MPFSRGQEGPLEPGPNRAAPGPGRGAFPHGGRGPPPSDRQPLIDPATKRRRDANESVRRRQQFAQLRIDLDLVPETFKNAQITQYQNLSKVPEDVPDRFPMPSDSAQLTSAYMYSAVHSEQPSATPVANKGVDKAAFDAAVELYQRPHAAQWMRPSQHGNFRLTSVQIMANV